MVSINVSTDQHASRHAPGGADPINMGLIQDGAVAGFVNTPGSATGAALAAGYVPQWKANTAYVAGQAAVNPSGDLVTAKANFTSGTTYNAANWNLSASYAPKTGAEVSIWDFAPASNGAGTVDDSAAITAAIAAAGAGGTIHFGKTSLGLTSHFQWGPTTGIPALANSQNWIGGALSFGAGGGAPYGGCSIYFPNLVSGQKAISASVSCRFERLYFRGPGVNTTGVIGPTNAGTANAHCTFVECQFYDWDIATQLNASYYTTFDRCEWRHNNIGLDLTNVCYNVNIVKPRFDGSGANVVGNVTPTYGTCIRVDAVEGLNIYGGSMESYGSHLDVTPCAGILVTNKSQRGVINTWGLYSETACDKGTLVDMTNCTALTFNAVGSNIALNNHSRVYAFTGQTNCVVSFDNYTVFGTDPSSTAPILFGGTLSNPANTHVRIGIGNWATTITGAVFDNGMLSVNSPRVEGQVADSYAGSGSSAGKWRWMGTGIRVPNASTIGTGAGITSARPTLQAAGCMWFDTTIVKPIWFDGTNYRDARGYTTLLATKTANYTHVDGDEIVVYNGASLTATLPDPTTVIVGKRWNVKNVNASALTVVSAGTSKLLDGAASQSLAQWAKAEYVSDGTQWLTV